MWYYAESNTRPATVDETSSKKYVYVRRNIEQRERTDDMGETIIDYAGESVAPEKVVLDIRKEGTKWANYLNALR
jgi:hypothetical protein